MVQMCDHAEFGSGWFGAARFVQFDRGGRTDRYVLTSDEEQFMLEMVSNGRLTVRHDRARIRKNRRWNTFRCPTEQLR